MADRLPRRLGFVHGAEHMPAAPVELGVVEPRRRLIRFDRRDRAPLAGFEIVDLQPAVEACQNARSAERGEIAEPSWQGDRAGLSVSGPVRPESSAENVGPLNFAVSGRPEHALAALVRRFRDAFPFRVHAFPPGSVGADTTPQRLDAAAPRLGVDALGFGGLAGFGRATWLFALLRFGDEHGEPLARVFAVARLAREFLREDDDHAVLRRPRARQLDQLDRDVVGKARRAARVEAQLHGGRNLVDILPAGAGGANESLDDLALVDFERPHYHDAAHRSALMKA